MNSQAYAAHPEPRRIPPRGWVIGVVVLALFAVAYGLVVREYQVEGNLTTSKQGQAPDDGILAMAQFADFDARTNTLTMRFQFEVVDQDLLDDGDRLQQGIRIIVYGDDGTHEVKFAAGEPIGNTEIQIGTSGEVYAYPLDKYEGFLSMTAETFQRGSEGLSETTGTLNVDMDVVGAVSGWDIRAGVELEDGFPFALMSLERSFSNRAFAVVLLAMALTVAVLASVAAIMTVTNRRRFEVALLTWNGALLFALPLLRSYLPGTPPIGAAIDIYLYLWIFVIAVSSLVLMLMAWSQQRKADLLEEHAKLEGASHAS
jgi:hypothetical protein